MRMLLLMSGLCASLAHAASLPQGYLEFQDYRLPKSISMVMASACGMVMAICTACCS